MGESRLYITIEWKRDGKEEWGRGLVIEWEDF